MSWLGLVAVVIGLYLAFRLVGMALRLAMWLLVIVGAYWFLAPTLGWPTLSDLVYVLGPDFDGRRIEEVFEPSRMAGEAAGRAIDSVVDKVGSELKQAVPGADLPDPVAEPSEQSESDIGAGPDAQEPEITP